MVGAPGARIRVRSVAVRERGGRVTDSYRVTPYDSPPNGREHRLLAIRNAPEDEETLPRLENVRAVTIEFRRPRQAAHVERVMLISALGETLIERLDYLRERFNVEMGLITEHAGLHFRNPYRSRLVDPKLKEHVESFRGPTEAYNGNLTDDDGNLIFSTDSDNPYSFCRMFPNISRDQEFRFVVPLAAAKASGWEVLQLVTPSPTRAGGGIYWAQRTSPNIDAPKKGSWFDGHSRQDTFAGRISRLLEITSHDPGQLWPIYTHLGSLGGRPLPQPYFDPGPMLALQDRVFNISGTVPPRSRLWFTAATVLYDYALMMRGVADHVSHADPDTVHIRSWMDFTLGKTLPRSPAQLHGLTFHVHDPWKAEVYLDDRRIERVVRNRADESGRPSVTIAETDRRYVLFDRLDPMANDAPPISGGEWTWAPPEGVGAGFGRLAITGKDASSHTSVRLSLHGWTPTGAQAVAFSVRPDDGTRWGFFFETRAGGGFYFGNEALAGDVGRPITASYFFPPVKPAGGEWRLWIAPFHDLAWAKGAAPGGPMPSHPLEALTIVCAGAPGSGVGIDRVEFLRPRMRAHQEGREPRWCLGGRLPIFETGATVEAAALGPNEIPIHTAVVDQRGYFCFGLVSAGVYKIWARSGKDELHDRRGPLIEVGADLMSLVLDRRESVLAVD
ncbi:MAG: hypothetical protein H0X27_05295 [Caulobacteraceae bacterium]|nr:hypothetical protein [Caulobacteraceae bacterium]